MITLIIAALLFGILLFVVAHQRIELKKQAYSHEEAMKSATKEAAYHLETANTLSETIERKNAVILNLETWIEEHKKYVPNRDPKTGRFISKP